MPFFKTTYNILKKYDEDELFDPNWMDSDKIVLPPKTDWDYSREMKLEDVDIWEVIYEQTNGVGLYAAWSPYAEFYLFTVGLDTRNPRVINTITYWDRFFETYYGQGALDMVKRRIEELGLYIPLQQYWVDDEDMWLYQQPTADNKQKLILP